MGRGQKEDDKKHASAHAGNARVASKFTGDVTQALKRGMSIEQAQYFDAVGEMVTDGINAAVEAVAQGAHVGITCVAGFMPLLFRCIVAILHKERQDAARAALMAELHALLDKTVWMEDFLYHLLNYLAVRQV